MSASDWLTGAGVLIAGGLGITGIVQAARANRGSDKGVRIAEEANLISRRADERAERLETVEFERSDVEWRYGLDEAKANWVIENIGQDTAYDVQVTIDIDEARFTNKSELVEPRRTVAFDIAQEVQIARRAEADSANQMRQAGYIWGSYAHFHLRQRISWRSSGGRPFLNTDHDENVRV